MPYQTWMPTNALDLHDSRTSVAGEGQTTAGSECEDLLGLKPPVEMLVRVTDVAVDDWYRNHSSIRMPPLLRQAGPKFVPFIFVVGLLSSCVRPPRLVTVCKPKQVEK
jgi:hypothetical protein